MAFSGETKMKKLLANEDATKVLEKYLPGISTNPQTKLSFAYTLKQMAGFPQANISPETLEKMVEELSQINAE